MKKGKSANGFRVCFTGAVFLWIIGSAIAQQDSAEIHRIREVVISATRSEQDPDSVGRSITVISSEKIRNSGASTLAEILSREEGIYIVGTGQNPGQIQNLFMRGANSNQTAIMIDGIRMTDPTATDNAIDFSEISLADIDRIEIIRGAQSTMYGSSAIGGIINIITKKGRTPGLHVDADVRTGVFGDQTSMFSQQIGLNYTFKNGFYASGEVFNNLTHGLDATVDTVTDPKNYTHNHRERDGFQKTDGIGKLGYHNEKLDVFASYKRVHQKADIDAGAFTDDPAYTVEYTRNLFTWGGSYKLNKHLSLSYIGGMTSMKRVAIDDSSIVDYQGNYNHNYFRGVYQGSNLTNEIQANYRTKGINAVIGAGAFNEKMTSDNFFYSTSFGIYESHLNLDSLHISVNTTNVFAHLDLDGSLVKDSWKIVALGLGIRNTQHDLFGNNLTYEINPSLKMANNGLLYVSWATGFNAPSLYQLYDADQDPGSHITRGNNTLKAETSASFEAGFKQKLNSNVSYHFSYFHTVVDNSIDYVYMWAKNKPVDSLNYTDYKGDTYVNIGKQTNQGVEIGLSSKLSEKLFLSGNVSLINGKLDYNPANIDTTHTHGNQIQLFTSGAFLNKQVHTYGLVRRPSTANISLSYKPCKKLYIQGDVRYVGPRYDIYYSSALGPFGAQTTQGIGDYILVDLSARYQIMKGFSAGIRAENLLNEKYYEIYGYTTRGRGFYLNLRYSF